MPVSQDVFIRPHDSDGNFLAIPNPTVFNTIMYRPVTWDSRNRLATLESAPLESTPTAMAFRYDSEGNRYEKTVNGQSTYYATNSHGVSGMSEVCMEFRPDGKQSSYVWGGPGVGLLYEVRLTTGGADEGIRCYHTDQVGSTLALSDGTGTVTGQIEYSPYGFITRTEGVTDTPFPKKEAEGATCPEGSNKTLFGIQGTFRRGNGGKDTGEASPNAIGTGDNENYNFQTQLQNGRWGWMNNRADPSSPQVVTFNDDPAVTDEDNPDEIWCVACCRCKRRL